MSLIEQLVSTTEQLISVLDAKNASVDRDHTIQKIHMLLEKRTEIIRENPLPANENELRLSRELLLLNEQAQNALDLFFQQLKKDMRESQMQRKSNRSYTSPYTHVQLFDGMYVDQKN